MKLRSFQTRSPTNMPRLLGHGDSRFAGELRESSPVLAGGQDAVEAQPLADELVQRFAAPGMVEHAPRGLLDALRCRQFARAAAANNSASGMLSQIAYESRLAVTYGFHFGSEVSSRRNRKFDDWSIASTTSCAPLKKSFSLLISASYRFCSLGFQRPPEAFSPNSRTKRAPAGSRRLARNQPARVAAAEGIARQPFGGGAIRLRSAAAKDSAPATGSGIR